MDRSVKVFLTGRVSLEGPHGTVGEADLPGNQARVALAVLVHERRPIHRDRLAHIIWNGDLPGTWNPSLNAIMSKIRRQLARTGLDDKSVLVGSGGSYSISLPPRSWVDIEDALRRVDRAEGAARHGDHVTALPEATVASSILQRSFLAGVDSEWVGDVRRQLRTALYRSYLVLASGWGRQGDHQLAITVAERAIELDPIRETAYRLLMTAELDRGDTIAALNAFDRCERMVRREFGASPSTAMLALANRAQGG